MQPQQYEYRVVEHIGRSGPSGRTFPAGYSKEVAEDTRKSADFIPQSGWWQVQRRPVGEWTVV